jgi:hypothetical protein
MSHELDESLVWDVRQFIYTHLTQTERPPTIAETAAHFRISLDHAARLYQELHDRHAIFVDPQTAKIRMANPYSAVPTRFRVFAGGHAYWANCAWDALGIPAMLGADARIAASCADNDQPIALAIRNGQLEGDNAVVHFPLPFARWYDDLVFT